MSKEYNNEIGHEALRNDLKQANKRLPKGVSITAKGSRLYLQFKTSNKPRSQHNCNCTFSIDGIFEAVNKANKVSEALRTIDSETEFWQWYEREIKQDTEQSNDLIKFGDAIKRVEVDFWERPSRTKRIRDKRNPSDQNSWYRTYGTFYKFLPTEKTVNLKDIAAVIGRQRKGTKNYRYVVSAMKKLARMNKQKHILEALEDLNVTQTVFLELQSIDLEAFLSWRDEVLGITKTLDRRCNLDTRQRWLWAFSTQIVYGLRMHEVIAIQNLTEPFITTDGVPIPALSDKDNTDNLIVIGDYTILGTTTKTGYRIARPNIPPKYPDLIERLDIKNPLVPKNRPRSKNPLSISSFWTKTSRDRLVRWNAPFTQTHADRHLGNVNGMQAGISLEVRAQSLGHTPAVNDSNYKNRLTTQTTIDLLLNSNTQAVDFVTALSEAKIIARTYPDAKQAIALLMAKIYQKDSTEIIKLLYP